MRLQSGAAQLRRGTVAAALALYTALLGVATWRHTFWRDEAGAWLIGRDNSLRGLWHVVHYEGHPPLWFVVTWAVAHLTWNLEWIKLPNLLAALATAGMILAARWLGIWTRVGLICSYFLLFEYGLIDRSYMLGVALVVAAAMWLRRDGGELRIAVVLSLAVLTEVPAGIVAVCLYGYLLRQGRWDARRWAGLTIFAVSSAVAAATVWPPADSGSVLLRDHWTVGVKLGHALASVAKVYLPVPGAPVHFWNLTLLDRGPAWLEGSVGAALAVGLAVFFRRGAVRWFFLAASGLLLLQLSYTGLQFMRHIGWLFVVFVLALLLEGGVVRTDWRRWMLAGIVAVQAACGVYAAVVGVVVPFSSSEAVVAYLRREHLEAAPLVFAPGVVGQAVVATLERPTAWYPERHGPGSYVVWNFALLAGEHMPTPAELAELAQGPEGVVLITERPLDAAESAALGVTQGAVFPGEIAYEYPYYIYRRWAARGDDPMQPTEDRKR
jgi:hypothetical protein